MIGHVLEFLARVRRLLGHPPGEVVRLVADYASRRIAEFRDKWKDRFSPTHPADGDIPPGPIARVIEAIDPQALVPWKAQILAAANEALAHRFDLLGSGPVVVAPGEKYAGFEGHRYESAPGPVNDTNRGMAKRVRRHVSPGYRPIDWHIDFRSGYRWPSDVPSPQIAYGRDPGADVKFPWELARLQHAPSLAFAYALASAEEGPQTARRYLLEFQDEVLDFIAANPPRFGCNWSCAMDVGIRVANWLAAYDLFRGFGAAFDPAFEKELKRSVIAHGRHIVNNLEWFPQLRSNHYLANIAGLLFAGAYLPRTRETDAWLWLGAAELAKEIGEQFQPDGSSFEASTSYHRLSGEMALWAVAFAHGARERIEALGAAPDAAVLGHRGPGVLPVDLAKGRPADLLGERLAKVLAGIAGFTRAITRPDGEVVQVGDNDSGRFLVFGPSASTNDHAALVSGIDAACHGPASAASSVDALVAGALAGRPLLATAPSPLAAFRPFPDFGLFVHARASLWAAVRCGSIGQRGNGGHAHNDQLSVEVCLAGVPFVVDPGTGVYTPLPDVRNAFRSTSSHATLVAEPGEQNGWLEGRLGLFSLKRIAAFGVREASEARFEGFHDGFAARHTRRIAIGDRGLEVTDECAAGSRVLMLPLAPGVAVVPGAGPGECRLEHRGVAARVRAEGRIEAVDARYSPGYGRWVPTKALRITDIPPACRWSIELA